MKRIIAILTAAVMMMMSLVAVADASTVPYSSYAFVNNGYSLTSFGLGRGNTTVYGTVSNAGGYMIYLPPTSQSGWYIVVGYYVVATTVNLSSGQWQLTSLSNCTIVPGFAYLSPDTNINFPILLDGAEQFSGLIYIPAHDNVLYLYVGNHAASSTGTVTSKYGAYMSPNANVYFVPDTGGSDYSSLLQTINASIQSVYQALLANGQTESAINSILEEVVNTLQSILSSLQSSGGDVSGILSALDDVNDNLQAIISRVTSSSVDNDFARRLLESMDKLLEEIDDFIQQIDDNTNRPSPGDIVPSIPPQLLPPTDETAIAGRDAISGILSSSFFVTFLLMVFSLAFLRYVLFGKSR